VTEKGQGEEVVDKTFFEQGGPKRRVRGDVLNDAKGDTR